MTSMTALKSSHVDIIETEPEMQPETVLKELRRLAQSPIEVVWKWVFLAVLVMFGWLVWLAFESNQRQPERLYELIERQIMQNSESLKVQEKALNELQQLAVTVPLEHRSAETKLTLIDDKVSRMTDNMDRLTKAVTELIEAMKKNGAGL